MIQKIGLLAFVIFGYCNLFSQEAEKEASPWLVSIDEAKKIASAESKNILVAFTGSDWCTNCIKLEREVLNNKTFLDFASKELVMVRADFPRRKKNLLSEEQTKHNDQLAALYNQSGQFPIVALINKQGDLINTTGYLALTPEQYVVHIKSLLQ